ncbi:MAG: DUF4136 domain-containing protein [Sphingopyxis sp.]|nr:DUF4136 domain-containing protein [Sphingopyxis sp.]
MRAVTIIKSALAVAAMGALSACATPGFRADVSRFQAMPVPQGQSFAVVAADEEDRGGLEFATYAQLVAGEMTRLGYRPAAPGEVAELTVSMDYGVDNGRERIVRDPGFYDPFWGPGWGYPGFYGRGFYGRPVILQTRGGLRYVHGFYDPFLFGPRFGDFGGVRSYTVFTSGLDLTITRAATGERVFEGSAEAVSRTNDLTRLVPNLVEAMFTGFPGNSGERVRITVAPPERTQR